MATNFKLEINKIEAIINKKTDGVIYEVANYIQGDIIRAGVIPFDKGDLQNTSFVKKVDKNKAEIIYPQPYAVNMWFGEQYDFQTIHNVNARHHWALPYLTPNRIEKYTQAIYKKRGF